MTDETPTETPLTAYNREKGERTRRLVYAAMQALGPDALRKDVCAYTGINSVSVSRAMKAIREGWVPK